MPYTLSYWSEHRGAQTSKTFHDADSAMLFAEIAASHGGRAFSITRDLFRLMGSHLAYLECHTL